jgi:hypothetical protein
MNPDMCRANSTPDGIFRIDSAVTQTRPAFADLVRHVFERPRNCGMRQKIRHRSDVCGRSGIQEGSHGRRYGVTACRFHQKTSSGQKIAKDADAAFGRLQAHGDFRHARGAAGDHGEQVQIDGCLECLRALEHEQRFHDQSRIGCGVWCCTHDPSS